MIQNWWQVGKRISLNFISLNKMNRFKFILIITIYFLIIFGCKKDENNYYRAGIIIKDSISLKNGITLSKGEIVKILHNKSTEESTFIKIKSDSGKIYWKYVKTLCWLKRDIEVPEIGSNKMYKLIKNNWLILEDINDDNYIVSFHGKKFKINQKEIYFDNKIFFDDLIELKR